MTDQHTDDDGPGPPSPTPWYNRTPAVVGASVAGLALIGIVVAAITFVSRHFNEPEQAPLDFVEFSTTVRPSSTPTTTATITTTSRPVTSDIDTPSSSTTSSSSPPATTHTTRRTPRTNVTRTLYPPP